MKKEKYYRHTATDPYDEAVAKRKEVLEREREREEAEWGEIWNIPAFERKAIDEDIHDLTTSGFADPEDVKMMTYKEKKEFLEKAETLANKRKPTRGEIKDDHVQGEVYDHDEAMHELGRRLGLE